MDRKAWTVVIACIAALGLWQWAYVQYYAPTPEQLAEQLQRHAPIAIASTSPARPSHAGRRCPHCGEARTGDRACAVRACLKEAPLRSEA